MKVKELREFLSNYPDDMEVKYDGEMSALPINNIEIETKDLIWDDKIQNNKLENVKPYLCLYS